MTPATSGEPETRRRARGGSGLGLSIVQAIAHAHGGQATLDSQPGHGTQVRIWLPPGHPPLISLPPRSVTAGDAVHAGLVAGRAPAGGQVLKM